jgi:ribosome-binding protein 1
MRQLVQEKHQLQGQLVAEQSHVRNVEMSFQVQVDSLNQQLEHARVAAATASANDPHLLSELEQLRALRDKYENSLAELNINSSNLQNKLSQQEEELKAMNIQLAEANEKVSQLNQCNVNLETALAGKNDEVKKIAADLSSVKLENEKMQTAAAAPSEAQIELASLKVKMDEKEINIVRLTEENERLSEQLASSVERPAAEGEEATNGVNGHTETPSPNEASDTKEVTEDWRDKFEILHMEHEKMLAKQKTLQADFEAEVTKVNGEAELMKNKNNDLISSLDANKKSTVSLLHRLFPTLEQEEDVSKMEEQATAVIAELNAEVERLSVKCEEARKGEEEASFALGQMKEEVERISAKSEDIQKDTEELEKLQTQIDHYKSVLAQTEAMLTSLQASVESAETEWRLKLDVAKTELNELKLENAALEAKTTSAENSIEKQTEEVDNS